MRSALDSHLARGIYMERQDCIYFVYKRSQMTEAKRVYGELKQEIVTCVLSPGLSISEQEMCDRYNASRTPVREACRRLCDESLMQMTPFRGYSIPALTIEEYRNLHELQTTVEPAVAALAAERATPAQIKEIENWASYEYVMGEKNSYYTFLEWNRNFHICIAAASRNQAFLDVVRNVQTRLMRYYYLVIAMDSYGTELVEEHHDLVRAIKSGNPELARQRAGEHLSNTGRRSMNVDLRSANYSSERLLSDDDSDWLLKAPSNIRKVKKRLPAARRRKLLPR
ncbi:MAG TPA: GntR family transcriptional regulator [Terracidiphilus sp.]|nr:GntR family transcriptional regulator [Terracidiphilus sp.]